MYKLLIVEDEFIERAALAEFIDWEALGVEAAGIAESAEEAINLSMMFCFDILLTSIRLHGVSGLELAGTLVKDQPRLKVIINSGYSDFDAATQALRDHICSIITKPIDMGELKPVVTRIVKELDTERAQAKPAETLRKTVQDNIQPIRRHFFDRLVAGTPTDAEIIKSLDYFGMGAMQGRFAMLLCEADGFDRLSMSVDWEGLQMTLEALQQAVLALGLDCLLDFWYLDRGRFAALLCLTSFGHKNEVRYAFSAAERIRHEAAICLGGSVTVGIGSTVSRVRDIRQSFKSAAGALAFKTAAGYGQVIAHADASLSEYEPGQVDMNAIEEALALSLEMANAAEARNTVDKLFNSAKLGRWDERRVRAACIRLLSRVLLLLTNLGEPDETPFEGGAAWGRMLTCQTIPDMRSLMNKCVAAAAAQMSQRRIRTGHAILLRMLEYIGQRLDGRVTVADLADEFSCSPNFIGALFKKETGNTLTDHIRDMRLERAKEMLKNPSNRIGEVAIKVGYPNVSYFCTLFKKKYGANPGEYREKG